jgi:26S proteasome regulatory subunit N8
MAENNSITDDAATAQDADKQLSGPAVTFDAASARIDVHPLVLLSLVDHYTRISSKLSTKKRVVGLLLGQYNRIQETQVLDINNCFAVPFDEDAADPKVWFLDINYAEDMYKMFRKVLPKVRVVGWYSSGPQICANDMLMHLLIAERFCPTTPPVYCVVNTDPNNKGVPVLAYVATEGGNRTSQSASAGSMTAPVEFRNVPTNLGALEAEEIGIEHLLRDITDSTVGSLSTQINDRLVSLGRLEQLLGNIADYLTDIGNGVLPMSQDILVALQELVGLQPKLHQLKTSPEMITTANDQALTTFVATLSRTVMALYEVVLNRRKLAREIEEARVKREKELADQKQKLVNEAEAKKKATADAAEGGASSS